MLAAVKDNPALKDDMEGMGLYKLDATRGYLVVSSQGNDSYAVFRREDDNAYIGSFAVSAAASAGIDGISETDGLEVVSAGVDERLLVEVAERAAERLISLPCYPGLCAASPSWRR